MAESSNLLLLI